MFIAGGLLVPLVQTVIQSFKDRTARKSVGFAELPRRHHDGRRSSTSRTGCSRNIVGSRLFWIAVVFIAIGVVIGVVSGRKVRSAFEATPGSSIPLLVGFFFLACIVLGTLRGTLVNNLWWVIIVTCCRRRSASPSPCSPTGPRARTSPSR